MKMRLVLFFLAVLLIPATRASADPYPNFYIFLCFGQSNMEGGGKIEEQDRVVDPRFQALADFDVPSRDWKKGQRNQIANHTACCWGAALSLMRE